MRGLCRTPRTWNPQSFRPHRALRSHGDIPTQPSPRQSHPHGRAIPTQPFPHSHPHTAIPPAPPGRAIPTQPSPRQSHPGRWHAHQAATIEGRAAANGMRPTDTPKAQRMDEPATPAMVPSTEMAPS
eukprot:scaffold1129_cov100-Isochrysis_galbana.AAC.1